MKIIITDYTISLRSRGGGNIDVTCSCICYYFALVSFSTNSAKEFLRILSGDLIYVCLFIKSAEIVNIYQFLSLLFYLSLNNNFFKSDWIRLPETFFYSVKTSLVTS